MRRVIFHVDMDAFFASVEQLDNPSYKGKPVIVGATPGKRGVVSACSYEARKYGLHSAMPINRAYQKCPHGIYLPVRMERYKEVSRGVFAVFHRFTPIIQPVSIDEAFLDMSGCCHLYGSAELAAKKLKQDILSDTGLTASIGVAPIRMAAKIASDLQKPDGLVIVPEQELLEFLKPLPIRKIWGVGPKLEVRLKEMGIHTVGDLRNYPEELLMQKLGENGQWLYGLAWGRDDSPVSPREAVKSVSHETTFENDIDDYGLLKDTLLDLSTQVARRLRKASLLGETVQFIYRDAAFVKKVRNRTVGSSTNNDKVIFNEVLRLFEKEDWTGRKLRLIGVGVTNLETIDAARQLNLFDAKNELKEKKMLKAMDELTEKWGVRSIVKGSQVKRRGARGKG